MSREQKGREVALARRAGMSPQRAEELNAHNEREEWHAHCKRCGERLRGTLAHIREHRCHGA